jgi:hypothetical protein
MELTRPGLERIALALPRVASCLVGLIVRALSRRLRAIDERIESELGGDRTGLASRPASSPPASAPRPLSESARAPRVTVQTLRETGRLEAFTDADLDALLGATSVCTFAPGEMICLQGRAVAACYIVVSGVVAVVKEADGGTRCLTTLGPGTIAGQFGMLDRSPRVVGLRAETGGRGARAQPRRLRAPHRVVEPSRVPLSPRTRGRHGAPAPRRRSAPQRHPRRAREGGSPPGTRRARASASSETPSATSTCPWQPATWWRSFRESACCGFIEATRAPLTARRTPRAAHPRPGDARTRSPGSPRLRRRPS